MKKSRALKYSAALFILLNMLCICAAAQQQFKYKAALDSVVQNGFYTIHLPPVMIAKCQPQLEDIRVKDNAGNEAPYIINQQTNTFTATTIITLPFITANKPGSVVLQNNSSKGTNELVFFIKNTAATRTVTLSGSDDAVHWFVIKENIALARDNNDNEDTFFTQTIHFPFSSYHYFQISMQGKDSLLPLNIFKAGVYRTTSTLHDSLDVITPPNIIQHDSTDKRSYIWLNFDNHYRIDKLQLYLTGTKFFNRPFTLYNAVDGAPGALISGNITSGDSSATLNVQAKTNALLLVIDNRDNTPLTLNKAAAYQLPVNLVAYLDSGKTYNLFFGDSALQAPIYDLQYFKDSIYANTRPLAITTMEKTVVAAAAKTGLHFSGWLLWSIIIAVLLLLIYFSFALLKDINRKTTNTDVHL